MRFAGSAGAGISMMFRF